MLSVEAPAINAMAAARFDLAIGHFHDFCPVALARKIGVREVREAAGCDRGYDSNLQLIWITHGTSVYDFAAVQIGMRTFPSFVSHPLASFSDRMTFVERVVNVLWHLSGIDFVNLPTNLLHEENAIYKQRKTANSLLRRSSAFGRLQITCSRATRIFGR